MIGFIVNSIGRWQLKRRFNILNRSVEALNMSNIKSALLVFHITNEKSYMEMLEISTNLKRNYTVGKVDMLAYCSTKEIPKYVDDQLVTILQNKQIDFTGIPKDDFSKPILTMDFDLLVDFTPISFLPTDYFLALVNAKMKVGPKSGIKNEFLDLIIDIPLKSTLLELSKNIFRYLEMINKV